MTKRPTALYAMSPVHLPLLFPTPVRRRITALVDIDADLAVDRFDDPRAADRLRDLEVLITGWGCPPLDDAFLAAAPRLRAVLHAAGSIKPHVTDGVWERGITVCSAAEANATPVAEYTTAMVLLAGKGVFALHDSYHAARTFTVAQIAPSVGNFGRRVGIVGASRTGRQVIRLLRRHDLRLCLYDPYATVSGVPNVPLEELLATSDIVSLHAPATPETHHLLDRRRLALLRDGAVLINTARGVLVDTPALVDELTTGRISAVLDVTDPEPLPADSPLFDLPNVFLTPHVAGSHGNELARMGSHIADELERLLTGRPLRYQVRQHELLRAA
ncbi:MULTISPECIES: hydroxyacid dehydrogenase [Micromonospora]|uniref:hydroxyacid dehydrogenase n=1 Tax=Micromonospora TaxID=1873 RepID=UPI000A799A0E|nr:hydroxyacid dehydrogenase [Micromonospora haikouensis]